jgi:hypothetical protein
MEYLILLAALAALLGAFVYIRSMFKGGAKPNRITWLMWSVAPFIATAAAVSSGVTWVALPVFMAGFSPFLIFISSFLIKNAYWKLTSFDYVCGILSILAIVLWLVTSNPNVAIVFAIASDGLAAVPTLIKGWQHPETESSWPYIIGLFSPLTSFTAITAWTFSEYAFPAYLIVIDILLFSCVLRKKFVDFLTHNLIRR